MTHRRGASLIATAFAAVLSVAPAIAAGPALPVAPHAPLPNGTVLDYGKWRCKIDGGSGMESRCRGQDGDTVSYWGKFVAFGEIARSGYLTGLDYIYCAEGTGSPEEVVVEDVLLDDASRSAIARLWPLRLGKEAKFRKKFRPLDGIAPASIKVTGTRMTTVAGVERPVYVVEGSTGPIKCPHEGRIYGLARRSYDETWWYDPAIAAVVHYKIRWHGRYAEDFRNFEYSLKKIDGPARPAVAAVAKNTSPPLPRQRAVAPAAPPPVTMDKSPPAIEAPPALETDRATVTVAGKVSDRSLIAETTVDGRPFAVDPLGRFEIRRAVPVGQSVLRIRALDEWGNAATHQIRVTRRQEAAPAAARAARPVEKPADPFAGIHFGNYHALVIGNNKYPAYRDLKSAVPDAQAVARLLEQSYGFRVETLINANRVQTIGALAKMRATLTANDSLLIYYAGHGVLDEIAQQGYWLPVDAQQDNPANWISTEDITTMLRAMRARHVMVVADSCYSGTLIRAATGRIKTARDKAAWFRRIVKKRARTALVSGGVEPVVDSGGRGHSVFAKAFIDALTANRGVIDGQALFDAIKRPVVLNADQTPQYADIRKSGHDGGDFLFVRK